MSLDMLLRLRESTKHIIEIVIALLLIITKATNLPTHSLVIFFLYSIKGTLLLFAKAVI